MTNSKPVSQTKTAAQWVTEIDECGPDGLVTRTVLHILVDTKIPDLAVVLEAYAESELAALREQLKKAQDDYHDQVLTLKNTIAMAEAAEAKLAASECIASKIKIKRDEFCRQLTGYQTVENELRKMMGDRKGWPTIDLLRKTLERVEASERIAEGLHEALKKYGKHLSWTEVTPFQCRYDPEALKYYPDDERYRCNCGLIESESVLARYQAQKGKP